MTRSAMVAFTAFAFTVALAPAAWAANSVTSIVPTANRVVLVDGKATVRFMVSGQGNEESDCGILVNYGDADSPDSRIISRKDGMFPREFLHTFARAGQYTVTAKGERVKQTLGCGGDASTSVTIVAATRGRGPGRVAAASCPAGWELLEGSFNRDNGTFTCAPTYPKQRMECGPGLRYFEGNNLIGCRVRGNSQR